MSSTTTNSTKVYGLPMVFKQYPDLALVSYMFTVAPRNAGHLKGRWTMDCLLCGEQIGENYKDDLVAWREAGNHLHAHKQGKVAVKVPSLPKGKCPTAHKVRHASVDDAVAAMAAVDAKDRPVAGKVLNAYACACGWFHVGNTRLTPQVVLAK